MTDPNPTSGDPTKSSNSLFGNGDQTDPDKKLELSEDQIKAILKRNSNAQEHINRLEEENKTFRTQLADLNKKLETSKAFEDLLDGLANQQDSSNASGHTAPQFDKNELLKELKQSVFDELTMAQQQEVARRNFDESFKYVTERFGDKYEEEVEKISAELNLSADYVDSLAKTSPKAFKTMIESVSPSKSNAGLGAPTNSLRTVPNTSTQYNFVEVARLKDSKVEGSREAKELYNSETFQAAWRKQILENAKKEGSRFGNQI